MLPRCCLSAPHSNLLALRPQRLPNRAVLLRWSRIDSCFCREHFGNMRSYYGGLHSASLVIASLTACLALASAKECWVGEETDSCLLYLGAEDATKCSKLQMAFGARAPAFTITSPSRPCLALVPKTCTSLELPKCHTFEATQAMEALGVNPSESLISLYLLHVLRPAAYHQARAH